jgi:hypothetical protein
MANDTTKKTAAAIAHVPKLKGPPKQFQQDGHWIVKPRKTEVLVCACGNRYLKTRHGQTTCVRCLFGRK